MRRWLVGTVLLMAVLSVALPAAFASGVLGGQPPAGAGPSTVAVQPGYASPQPDGSEPAPPVVIEGTISELNPPTGAIASSGASANVAGAKERVAGGQGADLPGGRTDSGGIDGADRPGGRSD
jgi:hypothetical protein